MTGTKGVCFHQLYQMQLADELFRFTDMAFDEAKERRQFLRKEGDAGWFRV